MANHDPERRQQPMRFFKFQELGQLLFIKHANVTIPVLLGVVFLNAGLATR